MVLPKDITNNLFGAVHFESGVCTRMKAEFSKYRVTTPSRFIDQILVLFGFSWQLQIQTD